MESENNTTDKQTDSFATLSSMIVSYGLMIMLPFMVSDIKKTVKEEINELKNSIPATIPSYLEDNERILIDIEQKELQEVLETSEVELHYSFDSLILKLPYQNLPNKSVLLQTSPQDNMQK